MKTLIVFLVLVILQSVGNGDENRTWVPHKSIRQRIRSIPVKEVKRMEIRGIEYLYFSANNRIGSVDPIKITDRKKIETLWNGLREAEWQKIEYNEPQIEQGDVGNRANTLTIYFKRREEITLHFNANPPECFGPKFYNALKITKLLPKKR